MASQRDLVEQLFEAALALNPMERDAFLDKECRRDPELRRMVEALRADDARAGSFLQHPPLDFLDRSIASGTQIGQYEILSLLGTGAMGEVYRADDSRLRRDVAIKVLASFLSLDPELLRRFEQEARAAAALNHPNILAVFQMGTYKGAPYLVSELLEGNTLRQVLQRGPLPIRKVVDYGVQIARGLAAAHEKGIVHRDLKPENIFITGEGSAKILDFELAKLTQAGGPVSSDATTLTVDTEPGVMMGTVGYMSPEQVTGQAVDHRSDLFSLGAILYEMLSGRRAFRGETPVETMNAILKEDPPGLTEMGRNISAVLDRLVCHCMEKKVEERFQSARDVAFDLESLSLSAMSSSPPAVAPSTRKRLKAGLLLASLITVAVLMMAGLIILRSTSRPNPPPQYHQLTFALEMVSTARFAPDQRTVIYGSALTGGKPELFSVTPDSLASLNMGFSNTDIAAISPAGEMLLIQQRRQISAYARVGVLARAPLTGAAPQPILNDVQDADWGPDNQIAVARFVGQGYRLEYPIGHVLYATSGYISNVRVSPKGDLVAFADHPVFGDNSGTIAVVDSFGRKRNFGLSQVVINGVAWHPSGKEVWFSGSDADVTVQLKSVDLSGLARVVERAPGGLVVQDIAHDGRVLLADENERAVTFAFGPHQSQERDLTITNWTLVTAISPNGGQALLEEEGTGSHHDYDIYVRLTDGSPPVHVGEGHGRDFSPDMKSVLATRNQLFLIPLGPGEPLQITHDSIRHIDARFLPGGRSVVFTGLESGHKPRIYVQSIGSNTPRAISPEGVTGVVPTADGKFVFGFSDTVSLYSVDGQGASRAVPGLHPDDSIVSVALDGRSVLVESVVDHLSLDVFRVDLSSGRREPYRKIEPTDPAGVFMFPGAFFTPDGKYYAYSYNRILSELYVVDGLR